VELVDGGPEDLEPIERRLLDAGATPASGPSKLARALSDRLPPAGTTEINPVFAYARAQRDAIAAYDPGARRADPESVHKMRVATRRLRSTLKTFKRSFPSEPASRLRTELKWLAHQLGEVRDGQVLTEKLVGTVEGEGPQFADVAQRIRDHLDAKVARGREALAEDLNGDRYLALLDTIDELVANPDTVEDTPMRQARKVLRKADRLLDQALADGSDAELHEARKAYKQARYAVEVFEETGGKQAKKLITALTDLQDVLGAHQDSVVAREILTDLAGSARDRFPYGVLYAHQEEVGRNAFGDLPSAIQAAGKGKLRAWLD
jgi:CHAD domain-containing protein